MSRLVRSQTLPEGMIAVTSATEFDDAGLLALGVGDRAEIDDEFQDGHRDGNRDRKRSASRDLLYKVGTEFFNRACRPSTEPSCPLERGGFCLCIAGRFLKGYLPLIRTWPVERDLSLRRSVWCLWPPPNVYIL